MRMLFLVPTHTRVGYVPGAIGLEVMEAHHTEEASSSYVGVLSVGLVEEYIFFLDDWHFNVLPWRC